MDILKIVNGGIIGNPFIPMKKEWISAAIGAAIGVGSTIFGASKSASAEKEARAKEATAHNANMAYFNRKMNEDYADTASGRNMIRQAKDYSDSNWKKAQGASAVGGGTDAATAQAKEAGNRMVGNTVAQMASNDTARKDSAGAQMASENSKYATIQAGQLRTQGANIANAASAMGNAVGSAVSSVGQGYEKRAKADATMNTTQDKLQNTAKQSLTSQPKLTATDKAAGILTSEQMLEEERKKAHNQAVKD